MKLLITVIICLLSIIAHAATTNIDMNVNLSINGKNIASPRFIVENGKTASATEQVAKEKFWIEVTAQNEQTVQNKKGILMKFKIGIFNPDGSVKIISQPQILAIPNQQAKIEISDANKNEIALSVLAKVTTK